MSVPCGTDSLSCCHLSSFNSMDLFALISRRPKKQNTVLSKLKCLGQMKRVWEFYLVWVFFFSILHLHFKKLSLPGEESKQKLTFVEWLRLGSCVEVTVLSQCQPPFPRVVSCNVFIYHYRQPKFFFPFQFVLSKAAGFRQRSTVFPQ